MVQPQLIRFWGYLLPVIPSIVCSIFVLYHLLSQNVLRGALNNHVVILMLSFGLFYELTNIVWYIHFYRTGLVVIEKPLFCRVWVFIDGCIYVIIAFLMAWASIERHMLIFHHNWIRTKRNRIILHYIPLIICFAYPTLFYGAMFFVVPCDIEFDYNVATCNYYSCISWKTSLGLWDSIINFILPSILITIFSLALLARAIIQRTRANGRVLWRNYRKMTVQLLAMSALYFIFLLPPMILNTAYTVGLPWDGGSNYYWATMYLGYYIVLLKPFICILSLPEIRHKFKQLLSFQTTRGIAPISTRANLQNRPQEGLNIVAKH